MLVKTKSNSGIKQQGLVQFALISILFACSFVSGQVAASETSIPNIPFVAANNVDPNIMFILDDSGSMQFEIMPDEYVFWGRNAGSVLFVYPRVLNVFGQGNNYSNDFARVASVTGLNPNNDTFTAFEALTRSPQVNTVYYDPSITYDPWVRADGSLFPNANVCALHHPQRPTLGCRQLDSLNQNNTIWSNCTQSACSSSSGSRTFWPATYFFKASETSDIWNAASYSRHFIRPNTAFYTGQGRENRTDCADAVNARCTYAEEIQNFANWYTYYRTRMQASQAGIGAAFAELSSNLRVGYGTINSGLRNVDGVTTRSIINGVRPFIQANKDSFLDTLYNQPVPAMGTPLRRALDDAGRYFSRSDIRGPWSNTPGVATSGELSSDHLACRLSYTILMTDGYWNGDAAVVATGNVDNSTGPNILRPDGTTYNVPATHPFRDNHSNTLADVARYYWNRDLRTDLDNIVPSSSANPAFWQHMVTFGVGLGVFGSIDPEVAFDAARSGIQIPGGWPNPTSSDAAKIDDLLHAAVNSYGGFFSAGDPITFKNELIATLQQIVSRSASGGAIAVSSDKVQSGGATFAYATKFDSDDWSGDLLAYKIENSGVDQTPAWEASKLLPSPDQRNMYMGVGSSENNVPVEFDSANFVPEYSDIVEYIRGNDANELRNGGEFRNRDNILGPIVNSAPTFSKDLSTVFVGSSGGFLHAFDAISGVERFAFLPSGVNFEILSSQTDPDYTHRYAVDGEILVTTSEQTQGKNILVGALGRGGAGLFALDVTNPDQPKYLWEISNQDSDMGKILGSIVFANLANDIKAIVVGNGYESASGNAALYVINIETGDVIKKITVNSEASGTNGLSTPVIFHDAESQQIHAYAGDLHGNVWKFDLSGSSESSWDLYPSAPLFVATDGAGKRQSITAPLTVAVNQSFESPNTGKRFVWFGTGSYFKEGDQSNRDVQTWYGIIDDGETVTRGDLNPGGISKVDIDQGYDVRSFNRVTNEELEGKKGWYIDFNVPSGSGERIVTRSNLYFLAQPVLIASSIIPSDDPCDPSGTGFINAINPFTGGNVTVPIFITKDDSLIVDEGLLEDNPYAGSVRLNVGMPGEAKIVDDQLIVSGSDAKIDWINLNLGGDPENRRVLWMELIR